MASYRPGLSLVATRPLLQQTNIYLSVSSFGLLLLFPKNLTSLRSFRFLGALFPSTSYLNRQISICPFRLLVCCSSFPKTLLHSAHSGFREPCFPRPLTSTDKYSFVSFVFWSVAPLSQKPCFAPLIQVFGSPVKICESARDSHHSLQYTKKHP